MTRKIFFPLSSGYKTCFMTRRRYFFLVKASENQSSNFLDYKGEKWFSVTFEVNGMDSLQKLHQDLKEKGVEVGEIENRGHAGRNFVFYDLDGNAFDVWSELSPAFKK